MRRTGLFTTTAGIAIVILFSLMIPSLSCEARKMILGIADSGKSIIISVNDVIQIQLQGNPTTGYWWEFSPKSRGYLKLINKKTHPISHLDGAPLLGTWTFRAEKVGKTEIEATYLGPEKAKAVKPEDIFRITVNIVSSGSM